METLAAIKKQAAGQLLKVGMISLLSLVCSPVCQAEQSLQAELSENCSAVEERFSRYTCEDPEDLNALKNILEADFDTPVDAPVFEAEFGGPHKPTQPGTNYIQIWRGLEAYPLEREKGCALKVAEAIGSPAIVMLPAIVNLANDNDAPRTLRNSARDAALFIVRSWTEDRNLIDHDLTPLKLIVERFDLQEKWASEVLLAAGIKGYLAVFESIPGCRGDHCTTLVKLLRIFQKRSNLQPLSADIYQLIFADQMEVRLGLAEWSRQLFPRPEAVLAMEVLLEDEVEAVRLATLESIEAISMQSIGSEVFASLAKALSHVLTHADGYFVKRVTDALVYMEPAIKPHFKSLASFCSGSSKRVCRRVLEVLKRWSHIPNEAYPFVGAEVCERPATFLDDGLAVLSRQNKSDQGRVIDQLSRILNCIEASKSPRFPEFTESIAATALSIGSGANGVVLVRPFLKALSKKPRSTVLYTALLNTGIGALPFIDPCIKACGGDKAILSKLKTELSRLKSRK